jgi:hypothetical protein
MLDADILAVDVSEFGKALLQRNRGDDLKMTVLRSLRTKDVSDSPNLFWGNGQWQIRVTDEAGDKVCALTFAADRS